MAIPVEHLLRHQGPLVTAFPYDNLKDSLSRMIENDFSQLPVIENNRPIGFVTSDSIGRALLNFGAKLGDLHVTDAMTRAKMFSVDDELFSILDDLLTAYAVLVVSNQGELVGIVTNYDTTQYFRSRAEDIMLVEDIETSLKDHIRAAHGVGEGDQEECGVLQEAVAKIGSKNSAVERCYQMLNEANHRHTWNLNREEIRSLVEKILPPLKSSNTISFNRLTLNDYIQLARAKDVWKKLHPIFGISDEAFRTLLEEVRNTRNKLTHFRGDLSATERDRLRFCADWFKNHPIPPLTKNEEAFTDIETFVVAPITNSLEMPETLNDTVESNLGSHHLPPQISQKENLIDVPEGKYAPLAQFLRSRPEQVARVMLTFDQIEWELGISLPQAAREHRSWWANDSISHTQSRQWLATNWRVAQIDINKGKVEFTRIIEHEQAYREFFRDLMLRLRNQLGAGVLGSESALFKVTLPYGVRAHVRICFNRSEQFQVQMVFSGSNDLDEQMLSKLLRSNLAELEEVMSQRIELERPKRFFSQPSVQEKQRSTPYTVFTLSTQGRITDQPDSLEDLKQWGVKKAPGLVEAIKRLLNRIQVPLVGNDSMG